LFNLKWCGISGAAAFFLSLLVGLVSGAGAAALLRALIFGAAFFVLGGGIWFLLNHFVPDLFSFQGDLDGENTGRQVDISVGDREETGLSGGRAVQGVVPGSDSEEDLGDITDLFGGASGGTAPAAPVVPSAGISPDADLSADGEARVLQPDFSAGSRPDKSAAGLDQKADNGYTENHRPQNAGTVPADGGPADVLPDLDSMAGAFAAQAGESMASAADSVPVEKRKTGRKGQSMGGDFNPKDLASAIQTVLSKE
jgi:hypothetical protein